MQNDLLASICRFKSNEGTLFSGSLIPLNDTDILPGVPVPLIPLHLKNSVVFAMDSFGDVFVQHSDGIARVSTEVSEVAEDWGDLEAWVSDVISDPDGVLGKGFLEEWVVVNGPMAKGHRLTPKMPIIFGGAFTVENMVAMPIEEILSFRAYIYDQIKDLPDGARVMIDTVDD